MSCKFYNTSVCFIHSREKEARRRSHRFIPELPVPKLTLRSVRDVGERAPQQFARSPGRWRQTSTGRLSGSRQRGVATHALSATSRRLRGGDVLAQSLSPSPPPSLQTARQSQPPFKPPTGFADRNRKLCRAAWWWIWETA